MIVEGLCKKIGARSQKACWPPLSVRYIAFFSSESCSVSRYRRSTVRCCVTSCSSSITTSSITPCRGLVLVFGVSLSVFLLLSALVSVSSLLMSISCGSTSSCMLLPFSLAHFFNLLHRVGTASATICFSTAFSHFPSSLPPTWTTRTGRVAHSVLVLLP